MEMNAMKGRTGDVREGRKREHLPLQRAGGVFAGTLQLQGNARALGFCALTVRRFKRRGQGQQFLILVVFAYVIHPGCRLNLHEQAVYLLRMSTYCLGHMKG